MREVIAGWQWLEEAFPVGERFLRAAFEALIEMINGTKLCGGPEHSIEQCEKMIEKYAPFSLIGLAAIAILLYIGKLDSHRH